MIRVARIITRLNIGGPAIQAAMLSDRLRDRGFDTLLIHGRLAEGEGDMSYLLNNRQVPTSYLPSLVRSVSATPSGSAMRLEETTPKSQMRCRKRRRSAGCRSRCAAGDRTCRGSRERGSSPSPG